MNKIQSADGTSIAYDRVGTGPALILVDGALCRRAFGPMAKLAELLSDQFSVITYDRRGRGDSGDAPSYSLEREVEDLAALVQLAGGSAFAYGASSGAALTLHAAASGVPLQRVALFEPPYVAEGGSAVPDHVARLRALLADGTRGAAVKYFMGDMVGAPKPMLLVMPLMLPVWSKLKAVAHTLPYDATIMGNWSVPRQLAAAVHVPSLVLHGGKTDARLSRAAEVLAAALPRAQHRVLPGQNHAAAASAVAPSLREFFSAAADQRAAQPVTAAGS